MALAEEFNPESTAQQLCQGVDQRLQEAGLSPDEVTLGCELLYFFVKVCGEQLIQEPGLEMPGSESVVPYNADLATQVIDLFFEGTLHAIIKAWEYGLVGEQKTQIMQQLANEVFIHAKQVVASTYGQEMTPEIQFSREQQQDWSRQSAESTLIYFLNELDKGKEGEEGGPQEMAVTAQQPQQPPPQEHPMPPQEAATPPQQPQPTPQPQPQPPAPPPQQPVETGMEKFAAIALFLTALKATEKAAMLNQFTAEERQWIHHFSNPEHIERELHLPFVERHLRQLKERFEQAKQKGELQPKTSNHLATLIQSAPKDRILRLVRRERSKIVRYVNGAVRPTQRPFIQPLPPRVEEALAEFMQSKLERKRRRAAR